MELTHFVHEADYADDIWCAAIDNISKLDNSQEGRDQPTKELLQTTMYLNNPRNRFVFSREIDLAFALVEFFWHVSSRNDVAFLDPWNSRMKNFSDYGQILHGAYGYRLRRNHDEFDQLQRAYIVLNRNPDSRQVVLQIWDAERDMPNEDGSPTSKDIPCNTQSYLKVRDGKLYWTQMMRSHDLIWGFPYDIIHWSLLQETIAGWLGLELGTYAHFSDSLHVYRRHWDIVELFPGKSGNFENSDDIRQPLPYWNMIRNTCVNVIKELAHCEEHSEVWKVIKTFENVEQAYRNILYVIAAERSLRLQLKHGKESNNIHLNIIRHCTNKAYLAIWLRWRDFKTGELYVNE